MAHLLTHGFDAEVWLVADHMVYEVDAGMGESRQQGVTGSHPPYQTQFLYDKSLPITG